MIPVPWRSSPAGWRFLVPEGPVELIPIKKVWYCVSGAVFVEWFLRVNLVIDKRKPVSKEIKT
jgi:hypothetical protein